MKSKEKISRLQILILSLNLPKISNNLFESLAPKISTNTVNTKQEKVMDSRSLLMNFLNN